MHGQDYTPLCVIGNLLHLIYQDATGEISERVALVLGISADGLALNVLCLRRLIRPVHDVDTARRRLRFDRIRHCRRWRGQPVIQFGGTILIPDCRHRVRDPRFAGEIEAMGEARWERCELRRRALAEAAIATGGAR